MADVLKMQRSQQKVDAPQDWDKAVSVAYLRFLGGSKTAVAEATGTSRETIWRWENSDWWNDAEREAVRRWLVGLRAKALAGLETGVIGDGRLALSVVERLVPELRPVPLQHEDITDPKSRDDPREFIRSALHGIRERTRTD